MNAFGAGILLEPYWSSAVLATTLLKKLGGAAGAASSSKVSPAGEQIAAVAHSEPGARYDHDRVATTARKTASGWSLSGAKAVVLGAGAASTLLVSARTGAGDGVSVFAVPRTLGGVRTREYATMDGRGAADVTLEDATVGGRRAPRAARVPARVALEEAHDVALAALCADAVGSMKAMLDATGKYLQTREQFGQPIGKFQALQHRMADMLIHFEQAKSMAYLAAMQCEAADVADPPPGTLRSEGVIGQSARFIGQQAVQLHGGMGMADELDVSHLFRRLTRRSSPSVTRITTSRGSSRSAALVSLGESRTPAKIRWSRTFRSGPDSWPPPSEDPSGRRGWRPRLEARFGRQGRPPSSSAC